MIDSLMTDNLIQSLARPAILKLKPYRSARSINRDGEIFLDANESPMGREGLNRYPDPQPVCLRNRFSELYQVPPEWILVGRGADEAIDLLVRAFCEPNQDRILICPPTYGMYEVSAQIQGVQVDRVPLIQPHFQLDLPGIGEALKKGGVKLIFVCSPNNPTGTIVNRSEIRQLCEMTLGRALVVVDEAYVEFNTEEDGVPLSLIAEMKSFSNLVVLRTLSKAWAMAGVRCGVALAQEPISQLLHKVRAPYPLSLPTIRAVLEGVSVVEEKRLKNRVAMIRRERENLAYELLMLELVERVYTSAANFLLIQFKNSNEIINFTRSRGIILRDRSDEPGLEGCVRVSVGSPRENKTLVTLLSSLSRSKRSPAALEEVVRR